MLYLSINNLNPFQSHDNSNSICFSFLAFYNVPISESVQKEKEKEKQQ